MVMPADRVVVAVATPSVGLPDLETLLKRLLPNVPAPAPPPQPVPTEIDPMLGRLLSSAPAPSAAAGNADAGPAVESGPGSQELDYSGVFFLRKTGPWSEQVPAVERNIPGWSAEKVVSIC